MREAGGLAGHLELICDRDDRGLTRLRHQSFRAPMHLSKPYHDQGALVLNLINPTAGMLDGDRLRSEVTVERGARLLLTTPSANRIHTMRGGRAELRQRYRVAEGGSLEIWPEMLIPQSGARYWQHTEVGLDDGAEWLGFELLAPGRVASGEVFAFEELRWSTDVVLGGKLITRERYRLTPGNGSLAGLRRRFPCAYYASAILVSPAWTCPQAGWDALEALHSDAAWVGYSALATNAWVVKIVAADSVVFRRTMRAVRRTVHAMLGRVPPDPRRAGDPPTIA